MFTATSIVSTGQLSCLSFFIKLQSFTVIYDFGIWVALQLVIRRKRIGGWLWHR
jgi:hypothetical protein